MELHLLLIYTFIVSLCVGSFLNVVIYRLPLMLEKQWRDECNDYFNTDIPLKDIFKKPFNLMLPSSRCPSCQHKIKIWHNIPLVSYFLLKGKCAHCQTRISWRYPAIELLTALLSVITVWQFGWQWPTVFALLLTWTLIAASVIDIDLQILPDNLVLPLLWLGLLVNLWSMFTPLSDAVIGAIVGYMSLWIIMWLFKLLTGKQGMGHGDFKLFALFGAWLGWQILPLIILLASITGLIGGVLWLSLNHKDRKTPISFGPYLAIAGWIALLWGPIIVEAYLHQLLVM